VEQGLHSQGLETQDAHYCSEVSAALEGPGTPEVVFTSATLADGTWADVLKLAGTDPTGVPVIVVSRLDDIDLYLDTMESGAFDFIVLPVPPEGLAHVVKTAIWKRAAKNFAMAVDGS
jgi:DNA-binding NtrC family response regulator